MPNHIELGHALITMVEPEPASVADYNRWYEHDHFLSGVLTGPGAFAGRRFVATRDHKKRRFPHDSPIAQPVEDGSFVTVYWIERGQLDAHCNWGFPEAGRLAGLGRMRSDRHHVSTSYYDLVGVTARGERPVPVELALHHPYDALVMMWTTQPEADHDDTPPQARHDDAAAELRRALVAESSHIGQVVTFRPIDLPDPWPAMPGVAATGAPIDQRDVLAHCCFVDDALTDAWPAVEARLHTALDQRSLTPLLVAPFVPTVAGTDTYLDELW